MPAQRVQLKISIGQSDECQFGYVRVHCSDRLITCTWVRAVKVLVITLVMKNLLSLTELYTSFSNHSAETSQNFLALNLWQSVFGFHTIVWWQLKKKWCSQFIKLAMVWILTLDLVTRIFIISTFNFITQSFFYFKITPVGATEKMKWQLTKHVQPVLALDTSCVLRT